MPLARAPLRRAYYLSVGLDSFDLEDDPHRAFMARAVANSERHRATRLAHLEADRSQLSRALAELGQIAQRFAADQVLLDRSFVRLPAPRARPTPEADGGPSPARAQVEDRATRPPCSRLIRRQSHALPLYLTLLCVAQADFPPGTPVPPGGGRPYSAARTGSYAVLMGLRDLNARNRSLRLDRAMRELHSAGLVELPSQGSRRRYANFELLSDKGVNSRYRTPSPSRPGLLQVPLEFFTHGWHLVLTPTEIANLLMMMDMMQLGGASGDGKEAGATERDRWGSYGISTEVYETHRELAEFGLLRLHDRVPGRRLGKVNRTEFLDDDGLPMFLECFHFTLEPNAFGRNALEVVLKSLKATPGRPYLLNE